MRAARAPSRSPAPAASITHVSARAYKIPTESPEADGTIEWNNTVLVVAYAEAAGMSGIGYSYCGRAAATLIEDTLADVIGGMNAFDIPACWQAMCVSVRNLGRSGTAACAISAVDNALWDLKAKLLNLPLLSLLGKARDRIPVYGSGGFTTFGPDRIRRQIEGWRKQGIWQFKIKIGRDAEQDKGRMKAAYDSLPKNGRLFVDANGAYHPKEALAQAERMRELNIAWFEEPVSSDDIEGLSFVRRHAPSCMEIAAGEYGYNCDDFRHLLAGDAVDVLQADATRCLGITGFLKAAALSAAYHRPLSSHCAPSLHASLMSHVEDGIHIEYFSDHARIENMLFEGAPKVRGGYLTAQSERPGFGLELKQKDAEKFAL